MLRVCELYNVPGRYRVTVKWIHAVLNLIRTRFMTWFEVVQSIKNFNIFLEESIYRPNEPKYGFRLAENLFLDQLGKKHILLQTWKSKYTVTNHAKDPYFEQVQWRLHSHNLFLLCILLQPTFLHPCLRSDPFIWVKFYLVLAFYNWRYFNI